VEFSRSSGLTSSCNVTLTVWLAVGLSTFRFIWYL